MLFIGQFYLQQSCCGYRCFLIGVFGLFLINNCAAAVSATECTENGNECVIDAICDTDTMNCKCKTGFQEDSTDNTKCVKVFGLDCSGSDPCPGLEHSVCTDNKCACGENYEEKNDVCTLTVNGTPCTDETACESIANAECDETAEMCKCSDGYVMNVDVCDPENGAATLKIEAATLVLFIILTVLQKIG